MPRRRFRVRYNGRNRYFTTLDQASAFASEFFRRHNIVLGIDQTTPTAKR